jgi:Ricin-type beta-trefoil lectin domain
MRESMRLLSVLTAVVLLGGCLAYIGFTTLVAAPTARAGAVPPAPAGWTTVFRDGFAGRAGSAPAAANWFYDIGSGYGTGEIEQTTNSTRNVYLDGHGHLVLKATRRGGTWWSGRIETTRDDFTAPPGGELEMTASIEQPNPASGLGYWPAFWALGSPMRTGGGWPASGEIDMMEDVNGLNRASQSLHDAAGRVTGPGGRCLGNQNSLNTEGNPMDVRACDHSPGQLWSVYSDRTLRTEGGCLDVAGAGTASGTDVDWYPCNGTAAQTWIHKADGELVNPRSGLCLTHPRGNTAARLDIETCAGSAPQRWTIP